MRLLTLTVTAGVLAFAVTQIPQVLAQSPDTQSGASPQQSSAGQTSGSGSASTRSNARGQSISGRAESSGQSAGVRSESSQTSVGGGAKNRGATIRSRSQTRIGMNSGTREEILLKRKRAHGAVVFNQEPRHRMVMHHVVIKRRQPGVAVTGETSGTTVRSRVGGETNVRAGVHARETTGSSTTINRSQSSRSQSSSSSSLKGSSGSQSGQTRGSAGNQPGGNPSTTGQGSNR